MMLKIGNICLLLTALMFMAPWVDTGAYNTAYALSEHDEALKAIKRGDILSYSKIKKRVELQLNGRMVGERLRRTNRGWVYEVRVRQNKGRVVFAIIDARTGKILQQK